MLHHCLPGLARFAKPTSHTVQCEDCGNVRGAAFIPGTLSSTVEQYMQPTSSSNSSSSIVRASSLPREAQVGLQSAPQPVLSCRLKQRSAVACVCSWQITGSRAVLVVSSKVSSTSWMLIVLSSGRLHSTAQRQQEHNTAQHSAVKHGKRTTAGGHITVLIQHDASTVRHTWAARSSQSRPAYQDHQCCTQRRLQPVRIRPQNPWRSSTPPCAVVARSPGQQRADAAVHVGHAAVAPRKRQRRALGERGHQLPRHF